jgi:hypothetical protein
MVAQMSYFIIGGTNVLFYNRWPSYFIIGGKNVLFYNRWDKCLILSIGGTMVALMG